MRVALGIAYAGQAYAGWQSQPGGNTVQDHVESALSHFAAQRVHTLCAGRTDAGVHALMQVVHFDAPVTRPMGAWVRGTNRYLPADIAVQWAHAVPAEFHARASASARRYVYVLLQSPVRPSVDAHRVGWVFRPLDHAAMQQAADLLVGEHDFSSFRAAGCQALSPVKTMTRCEVARPSSSKGPGTAGAYWRFTFEGSAFLHHMVRNIMGCLLVVGEGRQPPQWIADVLAARSRAAAAPTFSAAGLYFQGPVYPAAWGLPERTAAFDWLP